MRFYEITFKHPEYSALDPIPIGMNKRYIEANSVDDALTMFKTRFERFKDSKILNIVDTECSSLEELKEWYPHYSDKINERT